MRSNIHDNAVEILLVSISREPGTGLFSSFMFGKPGEPRNLCNMGVNIYYRWNSLIRTALFIRQSGPAYLKYLPIDDIVSMLQSFVIENFWYLADDVLFTRLCGTFADRVSAQAKTQFSEALANSKIFQPTNELTLFPLVPLKVEADFDSGMSR